MEKFVRRQFMIMILVMVVTLTGTFYSSYAIFHQESEGKEQVIEAGNLNISYEEGAVIRGELLPMSDEQGLQTTAYSFTISNTGSLPADYALYIRNTLAEDETTLLDHSYIRMAIDDGMPFTLSDFEETGTDNPVYRGVLNESGSIDSSLTSARHEVRIWIKDDAPTDIIDKVVGLKLEVIGVVRES